MIKEIDYHGWSAVKLTTGKADLVFPLEVGPRVISCSFTDKPNLFANVADDLGKKGEGEWKIRGGHRLWQSPEYPATYAPDNNPIDWDASQEDGSILVKQREIASTGIVKSFQVTVINDTSFKVTHVLKNEGEWPIKTAAWALSVMAHGGYAIIPLNKKGSHPDDLLPDYHLIPWTYTDMSLPCWNWRRNCIGVDVLKASQPQKLGISRNPGWMAYWQEHGTFVKYAQIFSDAVYPDLDCAQETFCNDWMIELETLSPLTELFPGERIKHIEYWGLFDDLPKPDTDEVYESKFLPAINNWLQATPA